MSEANWMVEPASTRHALEYTLYKLALEALNTRSGERVRTFVGQFSGNPDLTVYPSPSPRPDIDLSTLGHDGPPQFERLRRAFLELNDALAWGEGYTKDDLGSDVALGGWIPLASSEGPIFVKDALLALTFLNARAYYPPHRHGPEEMYVTACGGFSFERPGKKDVWVGPGDVVFTERNEIHALRGGERATLMIACWAGGSYQKSEIVA